AAGGFQAANGLERVAGSNFGEVTPVEQLQELDDEFDVANPAVTRFHIAAVSSFALRALLDSALKRFDARDVRSAQIPPINPRLELFEKLVAELQIARDGTRFHERLPLPGASHRIVVAQRGIDADDRRPLLAVEIGRASCRERG